MKTPFFIAQNSDYWLAPHILKQCSRMPSTIYGAGYFWSFCYDKEINNG